MYNNVHSIFTQSSAKLENMSLSTYNVYTKCTNSWDEVLLSSKNMGYTT